MKKGDQSQANGGAGPGVRRALTPAGVTLTPPQDEGRIAAHPETQQAAAAAVSGIWTVTFVS